MPVSPNGPQHPQHEQRRADRRDAVGCSFLLPLDADNRPVGALPVSICDLSETGCGVIQAAEVKPGTRFALYVHRFRSNTVRLCEARHCEKHESEWVRVGVRFLPLPDGFSAMIAAHIHDTMGLLPRVA